MHQAAFRLQLITPTYLGGSDPAQAELRAPTFRGLLRYWLRAAAGAAQPQPEYVRSLEDSTFGSVNKGSPVSLWISDETRPHQPVAIHRGATPGRRPVLSLEQRYLYWSMDRRNSAQPALPAGTEFDLHLATPRGTSAASAQAFERALGAIWLLLHLGGIGARSRRGAGSLATAHATGIPARLAGLSFTPSGSADELCTRLHEGIQVVRTLFPPPEAAASRSHPPAPFDILARDICRVWVLRPPQGAWQTSDHVLDALGGTLRDYRRTIPNLVDRAAFGLPIVQMNDSRFKTRRASPLLLRVSQIAAPQGRTHYLAVAVLFKSQFLSTANQTGHLDLRPNYGLVERWVADMFPFAQEVFL